MSFPETIMKSSAAPTWTFVCINLNKCNVLVGLQVMIIWPLWVQVVYSLKNKFQQLNLCFVLTTIKMVTGISGGLHFDQPARSLPWLAISAAQPWASPHIKSSRPVPGTLKYQWTARERQKQENSNRGSTEKRSPTARLNTLLPWAALRLR